MKYLAVDDKLLFGGCDIDPWERLGYLTTNQNNFNWHEVGFVMPLPSGFRQWLNYLYQTPEFCIHAIPTPPPPLLNGQVEIDQWVTLITNAKRVIYLEHQLMSFYTGSNQSSRQIFNALVDRVTRSLKTKDGLRLMCLTNSTQDDEYCPFVRFFSENNLQVHLCDFIASALAKVGENRLPELLQMVYYGQLKFQGRNIKVHSNVLITDDHQGQYHCIRTSSNCSDRSFGKAQCDMELGLYLKGSIVYRLWISLMRLHAQDRKLRDFNEFWDRVHRGNSLVVAIQPRCDWHQARQACSDFMRIHPATGNCNYKMKVAKL